MLGSGGNAERSAEARCCLQLTLAMLNAEERQGDGLQVADRACGSVAPRLRVREEEAPGSNTLFCFGRSIMPSILP